ncbi:MAG: hypothetical protein OEU26_17630, partial [Candidatus Tectomicrobia bacterium]|nr:hypothetical protein [Candidatus Tectomicrobia bacterium]
PQTEAVVITSLFQDIKDSLFSPIIHSCPPSFRIPRLLGDTRCGALCISKKRPILDRSIISRDKPSIKSARQRDDATTSQIICGMSDAGL